MRRSLQIALGQHRGSLTQSYQRAVVRAGGRFSRKDYALDIVDDFFYGRHAITGGTFSLAEGLHKIVQLWTAVSDAVAAHIPVWGVATTSIGFVGGDWSASLGLLGGTGKALNSNVLSSSIIDNTGAIFGFASARVSNSGVLCGVRSGTSAYSSVFLGTSAGNMRTRYERNASTPTTVNADDAFALAGRSESASFLTHTVQSGTMTETSTTATGGYPTAAYFYAAQNNGSGSVENVMPNTSRLLAAGVCDVMLTTAESTILHDAIAALNTARASL